jgi:NurA-like 5'-3' nuclease
MIGVCVCSCYWGRWTHLRGVSLNRSEQQLFEYIEANLEERHFWEYKVRAFDAKFSDRSETARQIERELWRYFVERSTVVPRFKEIAAREGVRRVSLQNLSEYLMRRWLAPRPKRPPA